MSLRYVPLASVFAAAVAICGTPALAAPTYFYIENFESTPAGNNLPVGWTQIERDANDVAIIDLGGSHDHVLQLRDFIVGTSPDIDALAVTATISTLGWQNISLRYDWKGHETESSDKLYVEWRVGSDPWVTLAVHGLNEDDWETEFGGLGSSADNVSDLQIRFWIKVTDLSETCSWSRGKKKCTLPQSEEAAKIDNIKLKGYVYEPPEVGEPVPVPGALPLFASAMALYGGVMYRRKRRGEKAAS